MRTLYLTGHLGLATIIACSRPGPTSSHAGTARAASEQYRVALNAGDTAAFLRLLEKDLELFPPAASPLQGAAAHDLFRGLFANFTATLEPFSREEWIVQDSIALQRYSFRLRLQPKSDARATSQSGSGLHVWRRSTEGQWRLAKDIWSVVPAETDSN